MSKTDAENTARASAPKLVVEQDAPATDEPMTDTADEAKGGRRRRAKKARKERITRADLADAVGFIQGLGAAAWVYAEDHPFTVGYAFIGLVLAVLILTIGLWSTIVIAVFVLVGALLGQIRDGDNGLVNFFSRLFDRRS